MERQGHRGSDALRTGARSRWRAKRISFTASLIVVEVAWLAVLAYLAVRVF